MLTAPSARLSLAAGLAALAAAGCGPPAPVRIEHAWVRAADSAATTAAYFTLVNDGADTLHVNGVRGDVAATLSMHETVHEGAMVAMREVDRLDLPPHARLVFEPGGRHVMLVGLRRSLAAGEHVNFALDLQGAPELPVNASVRR